MIQPRGANNCKETASMFSLKEGRDKRRSSPPPSSLCNGVLLELSLTSGTRQQSYSIVFGVFELEREASQFLPTRFQGQRLSRRAESRCLGLGEGQSHRPVALHLGE